MSAQLINDIDTLTKDSSVVKKGRKFKIVDDLKNFNAVMKTYHYNPSPDVIELLNYFASLHRYDDRKVFKEAWTKWIAEPTIAPHIQSEIQRLAASGYQGDALQKIYKSVRYYYKKKPINVDAEGNPIQKPKKQRKKYEGYNSELLNNMDTFIATQIKSHIVNMIKDQNDNAIPVTHISPAEAFTVFVKHAQIEYLEKNELAKYKKTFKNRFFCIRKKCSIQINSGNQVAFAQ